LCQVCLKLSASRAQEALGQVRQVVQSVDARLADGRRYLVGDRFSLSDMALANALLEIDNALGRIERGTYGICEMSGRPIPLPRLRAVPFARFTVECQAEIEKRKKVSRFPGIFASPFAVANDEEGQELGVDLGEVG
jgi:RNA polymerase-binding transcription factor DksA